MKPYKQAKFEKWLRNRFIPYVSVKEVLLKSPPVMSILKQFHFVVYSPGDNYLTFVSESPARGDREAMKKWQEIFGKGFVAVFVDARGESPRFTTLDGKNVELKEWEPEAHGTPVTQGT